MDPLLEVRSLTAGVIRCGNFLNILDGVSFSINEGEIIALAGESGSGKSMTALSIAGLLPAAVEIQGGEILYKKENLLSLSEREYRRIRGNEISIIFQEAKQSLNPLMKAGNQIMESLEIAVKNKKQGTDKEKQIIIDKKIMKKKVLDLLENLGFDEAEKTFNAYPHQLSGGMCQRVMTAIAAINNPRLLLADEPSSSLDQESRDMILFKLAEMNRRFNTSILVISHDLSIIQKLCSRFLIMYAGKIIEEGPSDSLYSPLHPYTKALIGAIPGKEKRGIPLENISGKVPSIEDRFPGCPFAPRCQKVKNICKEAFPPEKSFENRKVHCYFPEGNDGIK